MSRERAFFFVSQAMDYNNMLFRVKFRHHWNLS